MSNTMDVNPLTSGKELSAAEKAIFNEFNKELINFCAEEFSSQKNGSAFY